MKKTAKVLSFLFLTSVATTRPIPENLAHILAGGTGAAAGLGTYLYKRDSLWWLPAGALGGFIGYFFWHQFTPAGRMKRAMGALEKVRSNYIANTTFENEDKIMEAVQEMYISSTWPLISAFNDLTNLLASAQRAIDLANASFSEDSSFEGAAKTLITEAKNMIENITKAVKAIRTNKEYLAQLDQYKKEQQHQEKLAVQQSMAQAQWHSAHAQWHKAYAPKHAYNHAIPAA